MTYIRDSFGRVVSEGSGKASPAKSSGVINQVRSGGDALIESLLSGWSGEDGGRPGSSSGKVDDEALKELEGEVLNMFGEEDF